MGGVRTALFNYLFAKKHGGDFLLRIEDTDQNRFVPGAEEYIIESLKWCGLNFDEGPGVGGNYGPYRQSERKSLYKQYADQLLESGWAYYAFDTPEELEKLRLDAEQDRVVTEVAGRWPGLAVLVNNAGIQVNLPATGIGDGGMTDALRREVEINLIAPVVLSLGLMPLLARQPEAAIVNIASGLAIAPKRTAPVYCATKAGLRSFSQALRYRCVDAAPAIRVIDVIMSYVDTAMTQDRGGTKIASADAARAVIDGIEADRDEVWVGRTRLLRLIHRLSPTLAARILRNA